MNGEFRVWCKNKNEWEKDYCVLTSDGVLLHRVRSMWVPLDRDTHIVQFYTGLKDKNGKKIFGGDIVKSLCQVFLEEDQDALISEVYYHDSYAAFYLLASNRDFEIDEPLAQSIHNYEILEVIGNIHDNPELIRRKNNEIKK